MPGITGSGLAGRLLGYAFSLLGVSIITFCLSWMAPGDPAEMLLQQRHQAPDPAKVAALRHQMGLDDPLWMQYLSWLGNTLSLDLGTSYTTGQPVIDEITPRFWATMQLAAASFVFLFFASLAAGVIGAAFRERFPDRLIRAGTILSMSLPNYWLGLLLLWIFALHLRILPVMGMGGAAHLVLPAITMGLSVAAMQGRVLRSSIIDIQGRDFIRFARGKGLGPWQIMRRHVLKNAMLPVITMWGLTLGHMLGGSVIVETVFAWPGLGQLAAQSIQQRNVPVLQAVVLLMALIFITANLLVDLLQRRLDPRIELEDARRRNGQ